MFSVELEFTTDTLLKWFCNIYKSRFFEIDTLTKQKYEKNNPIDWSQTKCSIYDYEMLVGSSFCPLSKEMIFMILLLKNWEGHRDLL